MKKFDESDIFVNTVRTYPKVRLFSYRGRNFLNNTREDNIYLFNFLQALDDSILTEIYENLLTETGEFIIQNLGGLTIQNGLLTESGIFIISENSNNLIVED